MDDRYSQRQIDDIIRRGSLKTKITLYLRDRMGYFGEGFILQYSDIDRLNSSISETDREEWDKKIGYGSRLENGFKDLGNLANRIGGEKINISRILKEIQDFEQFEEMINRMAIDDKGHINSDISQKLKRLQGIHLNLSELEFSPDSLLNINMSKEGGLIRELQVKLAKLREMMFRFLCYVRAIEIKISEYKLTQIPEYINRLEVYMKFVGDPVVMLAKYRGVQDVRPLRVRTPLGQNSDPQGTGPSVKNTPFPSLKNLMEDYSINLDDIDMTTKKAKDQIKSTLTHL